MNTQAAEGRNPRPLFQRHLTSLLLILIISAASMGAACGQAVSIGNPGNPGALAQELQNAYVGGARQITINPGTYNLPAVGGTTFSLTNWSNATINGYNVTIVSSDDAQGDDIFDLTNCTNVKLAGMLLSQQAVTHYQGRIMGLGVTGGNHYADWKPDAGYPVPSTSDLTLFPPGAWNVVNPATGNLRVATGDLRYTGVSYLGSNTFRIVYGPGIVPFALNDWLVTRYVYPGFKIYLYNCRNCTVQDVRMWRNGFSPLREASGGGNHFIHCIWAIAPPPAGSTIYPVVTNSADGFHSTYANPGPDIENCVMQGVFLDDCFAIHGAYSAITAVSGNTVTVGSLHSFQWTAGCPIRLSDSSGDYQDAIVNSVTTNADGSLTLTLNAAVTVKVTANTYPGYCSNPLNNGPGYKILNSQFGNTRSRAIIAKADNGLIQGNTITNSSIGVYLGSEYAGDEADYVHNVSVLNNTFQGNGTGVVAGGFLAEGNQNLTVKGNLFDGCLGNSLQLTDANGATVAWNVFANINQQSSATILNGIYNVNNTAVRLNLINNVSFYGNLVTNQGAYGTSLVSLGSGVTSVTNNNSYGIQKGLLSSGVYSFSPLSGPALSLDVNNATGNGTALVVATSTGGAGQQWVATNRGGSHFSLEHIGSTLAVEVPGGSTTAGVGLATSASVPGSLPYLWQFTDAGGGANYITSANSALALTVPGGSTTSGTQVVQAAQVSAGSDQWTASLVKATPGPNLLLNGSFETGTLQNWTTTPSGPGYVQAQPLAEDGSCILIAYSASPYAETMAQTVTGLAGGLYTATAYVEWSSSVNQAYMFIGSYASGAPQINATLPASGGGPGGWVKVTITDIPVTNGQCQVGFYAQDTSGGHPVYVDNVQLFRQ